MRARILRVSFGVESEAFLRRLPFLLLLFIVLAPSPRVMAQCNVAVTSFTVSASAVVWLD